jgi:hypothetical protein
MVCATGCSARRNSHFFLTPRLRGDPPEFEEGGGLDPHGGRWPGRIVRHAQRRARGVALRAEGYRTAARPRARQRAREARPDGIPLTPCLPKIMTLAGTGGKLATSIIGARDCLSQEGRRAVIGARRDRPSRRLAEPRSEEALGWPAIARRSLVG